MKIFELQNIYVPFSTQIVKMKIKAPRGRPKALNIEENIKTAMMQYWQHGIKTKSLNELCKSIGVSKPSFYREFEDEDGLMVKTLEVYKKSNINPLIDIIELDLAFDEILNMAIDWLSENREAPKGCLYTNMRLQKERLGSKTLLLLDSIQSELLTSFISWYKKGLDNKQVNEALNPEQASAFIGSQFTNILVQKGLGIPDKILKTQAALALNILLRN